ncbi:hypothetical protein XELAEV_18014943mg [Xenopus laevis]|uniref:Uncharacterized protein n=1 Tax=Xenopus laevis TaxID=8355 RepID=A0A974DIZ0_XENLA|nr:hypothetical protein XELAEV_18014943mg [Xenopus laevis]
MKDKLTLQTTDKPLPCKIVNAAQRLLQLQFQTEGLQPSYAKAYNMQPVSGPAVQIHSDLLARHCFTTCYRNGRQQIADSDPAKMSLPVRDQIEVLYKNVVKSPLNDMEYLQADIHKFDNTKMREHLTKCLENRWMTEFPKLS